MRRFDGRVSLVTGGGHGIGRASGLRLAAEGSSIVLADVDLKAALEVADEVNRSGGTAIAVACDVTDRASVDSAVDLAATRFGRLDVLVNTAGGMRDGKPFLDTDDDAWDRHIDLNLTGVARCIRAALPHLLVAPDGGSVVTIGSVNGMSALGGEPYSAAKAGLQNLTVNLASRYGPRGVRFNLIAPGTIRTRVWDTQPGALERLTRLYPLGRVGQPEDIAAAVAFLASDDAAWISGVVLPVDGGLLASGPMALRADR
jgi:NAD(P)-dependent dehydrogenase (short-subunit alcohol dehydrogenase family)